ncbi:uncharacterized protein LOC129762166 [Toxorhynchites rutilus septentrionalis]|uniref:uncharacterized protein LOC129762166 n=1 Tax=Toxorhynchites rutilus septentrionalis TaxID=329112 RepID=UPI00247B11E4|nr:uncharacterized protein LOC129762166 [Toxorhynchites rutilus septentrionalis]XP_055616148.1 uncharacterized protein LOC129762166 [Toxorhynchites rutilus septentrionalis]XP_055616150.1 uncharacterized protein LOC129762166 [Toxorhynchites rutilus septentrionalis]XP_055616151.1 uncharacterized protein LOC129762166 [Toxorhynchites rutilus septentrionalis]
MIQFCLTVLLLLITSASCADWSASCPTGCVCKWSSGKKSALCNSLGLNSIPTNLSTELQVLVLNDNNIAYLNREEFTSLGLGNLQKIHLKHSRVKYVHREAFKNLKILIEVDLSENEIQSLDKQTFAGNNRLRIINLYSNPLKQLVADQFPVLPYLRNIDLHDCQLNSVAETAFSNLELLEFLDLTRNQLQSLPHYVFNHMKNLKTLMLEENLWNCDCHLRQFRGWYLNNSLNKRSLRCHQPYSLKDLTWESLETDQFGCMPQLEIYRDDVDDIEDLGANITYRCVAFGDPEPTVTWDLNGKIVDQENMMVESERVVKFDGNVTMWSNLTILNITSNDSGYYTCTASNKIGFVTKNFSLILPEVVERVIIKTPETFWYFGLILGIFGTIFGLLSLSVVICLCKRKLRTRRRKKNIKSSVSFNDQEKKLLDLSITTNERQEFSASDVMTPSTKTDSTIAMEPVQITIESIAAKREEFPLNVGVFPPPPEFCSQMVPNPAYGNIFISVSVTQDALDNPELKMYPDLLNIPNRSKGKLIPVNVSSYATLPRKNRPALTAATAPSNSSQPSSLTAVHPQALQTQHPNASTSGMEALQLQDTIVNYSNIEESCEITGFSSPPTAMCQECSKIINSSAKMNARFSKAELVNKCENSFPCLKYDNMGRRYTASGNSTLSLPDGDRQIEQESIFIKQEIEPIKEIPTPPLQPATPTGPSPNTPGPSSISTAAVFVTGNDFVSL